MARSDDETTVAEKPTNVIAALAAIERELPGIGKDDQASQQQGGYNYRGIESITRHVQQLCGKYGVVFVLREEEAHIVDIVVNTKPWTDNFLSVYYDIYGPGGLEDKVTVGPIHVQGRDNSDKGYNKARTQAFKYLLLQVLCIGDGKDDNDGKEDEADSRGAAPPAEPLEPHLALAERIAQLSKEDRAKVKTFVTDNEVPAVPNEWTAEHIELIGRKVDALVSARESAAPAEASQEPTPASDAEAGGAPSPEASPASPSEPAAHDWDRDSLLTGIKAYEERLDEKTFPVYSGWLADVFSDEVDFSKFKEPELEQVWRKLDELTTEGAPAA